MTSTNTPEELAGELRRIAGQLEEAASLIEKLRSKRYRKWNQPEAVVDILEFSFPQPLDREQIAQQLRRCGYEFQPATDDPGRSVGATLSKLLNEGRVVKHAEQIPGEYGAYALWTASSSSSREGD